MLTMTKKKNDRHKAPRMTLRLPAREAQLLRDLAERNDRTVTAEVMRALRRHFQAEGATEPTTDS